MPNHTISFEYCDSDALPAEDTRASSLAPNRFHKLCPGARHYANGTRVPLGQPRCGDGSNFSFLVAPPAAPQGEDRVLIELVGGGACWDQLTCALQQSMLALPALFPIGSAACAAFDMFLCARTIAGFDFATYTTVAIPYCTQDVHLGDAHTSYDGGATVVRHVGAHNLYRTLDWVFENFPRPSHVFLTGCSAGGTGVPIAYDIINTHYRSKAATASTAATPTMPQPLKIDVVSDSAVFLTPTAFYRNNFPNWNAGTILNAIGFSFQSTDDEAFPREVLEHALNRSAKTDRFVFVTHDADQTSSWYYQIMKGDLFGRDRALRPTAGARVEDMPGRRAAADYLTTEWWAKMNNSLGVALNEYDNFDMFVMEGEGHCTFGLSVALQYPGFEEWLADTLKSPGGLRDESTNADNNKTLLDVNNRTESYEADGTPILPDVKGQIGSQEANSTADLFDISSPVESNGDDNNTHLRDKRPTVELGNVASQQFSSIQVITTAIALSLRLLI